MNIVDFDSADRGVGNLSKNHIADTRWCCVPTLVGTAGDGLVMMEEG